MKNHVRIATLALVFVLSTAFFWMAINEYILTSKAQQASDLQIIPHSRTVECHPQGECYLHILGSTAASNALAGVTGQVSYSDNLEPVRIDYVGVCQSSSYGLDSQLQYKVDAASKVVTFSVGSLKDDASLKGGNGCVATLVFKPVNVTQDPQQSKLQLVTSNAWKAGGLINGQKGIFKLQVDSEVVSVKIDSSVAIPTPNPSQPAPTGTHPGQPVPPGQCMKSKGDCNCDANIDLVDWEMLRSAMQNEGASCDVNLDSVSNALDASIWLENNQLVRSKL